MTCSHCGDDCGCVSQAQAAADLAERPPFPREQESTQPQASLLAEQDSSAWRREVSERLHRYRARRRPRGPRYPSLRLKFESPDNWAALPREAQGALQSAHASPASSPATRQSVAMDYVEAAPEVDRGLREQASEPAPAAPELRVSEPSAKIIEFPRFGYAPPPPTYELAEPVLDRPRILEAPEVVPPPPALGGMTIEEEAKAEPERRPGIDMPLQSAPGAHRIAAASIDALLVLIAGAAFGGSFFRITGAIPSLAQALVVGGGLLSGFWAAYQYLLIVYSGSTPGLRAMKLRVERFDGKPPARKQRRWRVLCGFLSAASLGMGYAWHFLDEDGLCWHERVTRTYVASER